MAENHQIYKDNLAAYALGALDAQETSALEAHLRTCDDCRLELADYQRVTTGLLTALPPQKPSPKLKRSLQKRLAGNVRPAHPGLNWSWNRALITGALVLLIGLNILSVFEVFTVRNEQAELNKQYGSNQTAIAMLAYPGTQSFTFDQNGISGSLLVDKTRNMVAVFAWHLPPTPAGKAYQMWLIDPQGNRTSGGFLIPDTDQPFVMSVIKSPLPLTGFTGLGVTVEPSGGSPKPTGEKIFRVDF
jgi:anti-sigma-K factor RskA